MSVKNKLSTGRDESFVCSKIFNCVVASLRGKFSKKVFNFCFMERT
jgi:hypothetical protein